MHASRPWRAVRRHLSAQLLGVPVASVSANYSTHLGTQHFVLGRLVSARHAPVSSVSAGFRLVRGVSLAYSQRQTLEASCILVYRLEQGVFSHSLPASISRVASCAPGQRLVRGVSRRFLARSRAASCASRQTAAPSGIWRMQVEFCTRCLACPRTALAHSFSCTPERRLICSFSRGSGKLLACCVLQAPWVSALLRISLAPGWSRHWTLASGWRLAQTYVASCSLQFAHLILSLASSVPHGNLFR